jgi:catechol 2,3-dioxygenase-like lactoylglutathione lyase family enzyme
VIGAVHVIFYVRDLDASRAFYTGTFARAPSLDVPGMIEIDVAPSTVLGLMPEAGITRLLGGAVDPSRIRIAGRAELYLVVDDPAAYHARAIAAGARELSPLAARDWGHRAAYSLDPDDHVLAFASALDGDAHA